MCDKVFLKKISGDREGRFFYEWFFSGNRCDASSDFSRRDHGKEERK